MKFGAGLKGISSIGSGLSLFSPPMTIHSSFLSFSNTVHCWEAHISRRKSAATDHLQTFYPFWSQYSHLIFQCGSKWFPVNLWDSHSGKKLEENQCSHKLYELFVAEVSEYFLGPLYCRLENWWAIILLFLLKVSLTYEVPGVGDGVEVR